MRPHQTTGIKRVVAPVVWILGSVLALVVFATASFGYVAHRSNPTWPNSRVQAILDEMDKRTADEPIMTIEIDRRRVTMGTLAPDGLLRTQVWEQGEIRERVNTFGLRNRSGIELGRLNIGRAVELVRNRTTQVLTVESGTGTDDPTILLRTSAGDIQLNQDMEPII